MRIAAPMLMYMGPSFLSYPLHYPDGAGAKPT